MAEASRASFAEVQSTYAADALHAASLAHRSMTSLSAAANATLGEENLLRHVFRAWWAAASIQALDDGVSVPRSKLRAAGFASESSYDRHRRLRAAWAAWRRCGRPSEVAQVFWTRKLLAAFQAGCFASRSDGRDLVARIRSAADVRLRKRAWRVWVAVARKRKRMRSQDLIAAAFVDANAKRRVWGGWAAAAGVGDGVFVSQMEASRAFRDFWLKRRAFEALSRWRTLAAKERLEDLLYGRSAARTGDAAAARVVEAAATPVALKATAADLLAAVRSAEAGGLPLAAVESRLQTLGYFDRGDAAPPGGGIDAGGGLRGALPRAPDAALDAEDVDLLTRAMGMWQVYSRHYRGELSRRQVESGARATEDGAGSGPYGYERTT